MSLTTRRHAPAPSPIERPCRYVGDSHWAVAIVRACVALHLAQRVTWAIAWELDRPSPRGPGGCFLSAEEWAFQAGLNIKTVSACRTELEQVGLVWRVPGVGQRDRFFVTLPDSVDVKLPRELARDAEKRTTWHRQQVDNLTDALRRQPPAGRGGYQNDLPPAPGGRYGVGYPPPETPNPPSEAGGTPPYPPSPAPRPPAGSGSTKRATASDQTSSGVVHIATCLPSVTLKTSITDSVTLGVRHAPKEQRPEFDTGFRGQPAPSDGPNPPPDLDAKRRAFRQAADEARRAKTPPDPEPSSV